MHETHRFDAIYGPAHWPRYPSLLEEISSLKAMFHKYQVRRGDRYEQLNRKRHCKKRFVKIDGRFQSFLASVVTRPSSERILWKQLVNYFFPQECCFFISHSFPQLQDVLV